MNGYFYSSHDILNQKYKKEQKEFVLNHFYDITNTLVLFWEDIFDEFAVLFINDNALVKKYKYLGKILIRNF